MTGIIALLWVPLSGVLAGLVLRAAGLPRRTVIWAALGATAATAVVVAAWGVTAVAQCLGESDSEPASWPWSPRREFCKDGDSPAALGALAVLPIAAIPVVVGTLLRFRGRKALGLIASGRPSA